MQRRLMNEEPASRIDLQVLGLHGHIANEEGGVGTLPSTTGCHTL
jgi:hypothetical protein